MAKCIQNVYTKEVKRVSNNEAKQMYQSGDWKYISKSDFIRALDKEENN